MSELKRTNKGSYYSRQLFDALFSSNREKCDYTVLIGRETDRIKPIKKGGESDV